MDLGTLDLTSLTWQQFAIAALAVSLARWVLAVVAALKPPNTFDVKTSLDVFRDHVLPIVTPIAAVAFIAQSFPQGTPAHVGAWAMACGGLALYIADTVKSAAANWKPAPPSA